MMILVSNWKNCKTNKYSKNIWRFI